MTLKPIVLKSKERLESIQPLFISSSVKMLKAHPSGNFNALTIDPVGIFRT